MKVTINEREYELKELTKEEAKEYIGKEVFVWDLTPYKRKLLEVFEPDCLNPFCILEGGGMSTYYYPHCAPVPEEWYVYEKPNGKFFSHYAEFPIYKVVDHGSQDYCEQKAEELNEQKESAEHPLTNYELAQLLKCFGVDWYDAIIEDSLVHTHCEYSKSPEIVSNGIKIRYKCGEWMPATRETVFEMVVQRK